MIQFVVAAAVGYLFRKSNQALKMDEQARHKYARAFARQVEAQQLVETKKKIADNALIKLVNRKKAILKRTMSDFLLLYSKIIKINFLPGEGIKELEGQVMNPIQLESIHNMGVLAVQPMSDEELLKNFLVAGATGAVINLAIAGPLGWAIGPVKALGDSIVNDSQRNLSNSNKQMKISNVIYSQAENLSVILDAITERSNRTSEVLAKLNLLFIKSIKHTAELIEKNGSERKKYSAEDRIALKTCINFADTIKKIIDVPMFDKEGLLIEDTEKVLVVGEEFLRNVDTTLTGN